MEFQERKGLCLTCSQEHNLILSILCQNSVHHNLSQGVVHTDTCEHWSASQRVDRAIHKRVESNETDHLIWEVFGGLDPCIICLAGTLMKTIKLLLILCKGFTIPRWFPSWKCFGTISPHFPQRVLVSFSNSTLCLHNLLLHVSLWWSNKERQEAKHIWNICIVPAPSLCIL